MNYYSNRSKGFTLIELIVVIAIIVTLAALVMGFFRNSKRGKSPSDGIKLPPSSQVQPVKPNHVRAMEKRHSLLLRSQTF